MASTGTVAPAPKYCAYDNNGAPLSGGRLYVFEAGTTTPAITYSNVQLTVANSHPVVLDAGGRATIFLAAGSYKFAQHDSNDVVVWTQDNISSVAPFSVNLDVAGIAGENIAAGDVVYLSDGSGAKTAGQWFLADSDLTYASSLPMIGVAPDVITAGLVGSIRQQGRATVTGPLIPGSSYYVGATPGALSPTAGTNSRIVGVADTNTSLVMAPNPPPPPASVPYTYDYEIIALTDAANVAIDAALGMDGTAAYRLAALGNRTIDPPTNAQPGRRIIIMHFASGAARTLTLSVAANGFRFGTDITGLTQTASGKTDYIGAQWNSTDAKWDVIAYSKGY